MFNTALYYPTIEIKDDVWLKTAILFWDKIETIVPEDMNDPYHRKDTRLLSEEGLLFPHRVNPFSPEVDGLYDDVVNYINSSAGRRYLSNGRPLGIIHRDDINNWMMRERMNGIYGTFSIHANKFSFQLVERLKGFINDEGFVQVSGAFMNYYMTLLANRICQRNNLSLLTDRVLLNNLSNQVMSNGLARLDEDVEDRLGLMYKVLLEDIRISPSVSMKKIIRFKRNRADELKQFRQEMTRLTDFDTTGMSIRDIENHFRTVYSNKVIPMMTQLKSTLRDARLDWYNTMTGCLISGIIPLALGTPYIGAALSSFSSITLSTIMLRRKLRRIEGGSPYTYLLKLRSVSKSR